jgi:uncharacterized protein YjlB
MLLAYKNNESEVGPYTNLRARAVRDSSNTTTAVDAHQYEKASKEVGRRMEETLKATNFIIMYLLSVYTMSPRKAGKQTTNVPNYHYHHSHRSRVILIARESTCLKNKQDTYQAAR